MRWTARTIALLFLVQGSVSAEPQALQDPLLERLIGNWVLHGTIDGKDATHDVTFEWVLAHQYVRMHEVSRDKEQSGRAAYEAIAFIGADQPSGQYACLWLDSTGGGGISARAIGYAGHSDTQLAFVFRIADGSTFHTTFAYTKTSDSWQWMMDGEEAGKRQAFARVTLIRK